MVTKTEAIKNFLTAKTLPELSNLYSLEMECQVNVAPDNGEKIQGEYKGHQWVGYTDGIDTWKSFRIPYRAYDEPTFEDSKLSFNLEEHVEGIGMTGWDWKHRRSKWVAFDYDSIIDHASSALTNDQLAEVRERACQLPFVSVRRSTGGKGLHLYVFLDLDESIVINNHAEHSAVARSVLAHMSALAGYDFSASVDICGGNMWVWHRKMGPEGFKLIKEGSSLRRLPPNWRDHVQAVVSRTKVHCSVQGKNFDDLNEHKNRFALRPEHLKLITWLEDKATRNYWWDSDRSMLVSHTLDLKEAHTELEMRGIFETTSAGTSAHNCFLFPRPDGGWVVRRYSQGAAESPTWDTDEGGWTTCYYNTFPSFEHACRMNNGCELENGAFSFIDAEDVNNVTELFGHKFELPGPAMGREIHISRHKDGNRLIATIPRRRDDNVTVFKGWAAKSSTKFMQVLGTRIPDTIENYDQEDFLRHLVTEDYVSAGWVLKIGEEWSEQPLQHINLALNELGYDSQSTKRFMGYQINNPWRLVAKPFQPEYSGEREWNRNAPQFNFTPSTKDVLEFPHWQMILEHVGQGLHDEVKKHSWCRKSGIHTGGDYLKYWIASLFQYPTEPLPYLFLYSEEQNMGKSILHEALRELFEPGTKIASDALKKGANFNAEIENQILCVIEELNLSENKEAYSKIKDWTTARKISIHKKNQTPRDVINMCHFIHCSNEINAVPMTVGDTRVTLCRLTQPPREYIGKTKLIQALMSEAPDFLKEVLTIEIPPIDDRLRIPIIETIDKLRAAQKNMNAAELFFHQDVYKVPGQHELVCDVYEAFCKKMGKKESSGWTKIRLGKYAPDYFPKGRLNTAQWAYGNMSLTPDKEPKDYPLVLKGDFLRPMVEENE